MPQLVLVVLSLLWAFDSLRRDLWPDSSLLSPALPFFEGEALHWVVLAASGAFLVLVRRPAWPGMRTVFHATLVSFSLFVVPILLLHAVDDSVPALTRVALFSLTPLFAVIFDPFIDTKATARSGPGVPAAMVAIAGAFCLYPFRLPGSPWQTAAYGVVLLVVALIAAVNCWAVRVAQADCSFNALIWTAISACSAALVFVFVSLVSGPPVRLTAQLWPEVAWTCFVDLPALMALYWLLAHMSAARMALRYVLAPLFTVLLSITLFLPHPGLFAEIGIALTVIGAVWLLLAPKSECSSDDTARQLESREGSE